MKLSEVLGDHVLHLPISIEYLHYEDYLVFQLAHGPTKYYGL